MTRCALVAVVLIGIASMAGGARANGGPSPGVSFGWTGVMSAGKTVRYVALSNGRATAVAVVRTRDGRVERFGWIRGSFGVALVAYDGTTAGLTPSGRTLVLASFPGPTSRFALLDTKKLRLEKLVALRGSFSFDAVSPDGRTLYLVQYLTSGTSRYVVRAYDLATDRLLPAPVADPREEGPMAGLPLTRVASESGAWVYTLYARERGHAFIHALGTATRRAVCIDLPWRDAQTALSGVRMRLVAGERRLVLRHPSAGRLASVDTRTFAVRVFRRPLG